MRTSIFNVAYHHAHSQANPSCVFYELLNDRSLNKDLLTVNKHVETDTLASQCVV